MFLCLKRHDTLNSASRNVRNAVRLRPVALRVTNPHRKTDTISRVMDQVANGLTND